jgi:hypothetical protein
MAASQDIGDVEMLAILAGLCVAAYIGYKIYSDYSSSVDSLQSSAAGQVAGAVGQAADSIASGSILTNNPISQWFSDLGTAISDPMGNSLVTGGQ